MDNTKQSGEIIKKIFVLCVVIGMIFYPIMKIFGDNGILKWHIEQEGFYKSGLQCIIFIIVVSSICILKKKKAPYIMFGGALFFMLMQGIIIPFAAAYIYFESICYIGYVVNQKAKKQDEIIMNFISGLSVWGALAIVCSVCKMGTINDIRIMTIVLVVIAFLCNKSKYKTMVKRLEEYVIKISEDVVNIPIFVLIMTVVLVLAAKTNVGQDFDSLWYMLKPEYTLVGENSFFDYLGFSAFVYYYPKLVEVFFLPLSGLGDYSFLLIANVMVYTLYITVGYKLITMLCPKCSEVLRLLFITVIFTLPAVTSVVPSVKGDVFGAFLVLTSIYFFLIYLKNKEIAYLVSSIVTLFLCTGTKLTFLLWGGIVGIIIVIVAGIQFLQKRDEIVKMNHGEMIISGLGIVYIAGIHFRTLLLTGYPIYPIFLNVWNKSGFTAKPYMKSTANIEATIPKEEIFERLYKFFFNPNDLSHTVMCWPTNIVIVFIIIAIVACLWRKVLLNKELKVLITISVFEMIFALYYCMTKEQPDGNYFYFPFMITCITCFYTIYLQMQSQSKSEQFNLRFMNIVCVLLLIVTIPLTFVVNWTWTVGIMPFTKEIVGDNFSDYKDDKELFAQEGYATIAQYVENNIPNTRIIMSGDSCRIRGAIETEWSVFTDKWSASQIVETYDDFKAYVKYANIGGFILKNDNQGALFNQYVQRFFDEGAVEKSICDEGYTLYLVKMQ